MNRNVLFLIIGALIVGVGVPDISSIRSAKSRV